MVMTATRPSSENLGANFSLDMPAALRVRAHLSVSARTSSLHSLKNALFDTWTGDAASRYICHSHAPIESVTCQAFETAVR
jgi:hypothetical protein